MLGSVTNLLCVRLAAVLSFPVPRLPHGRFLHWPRALVLVGILTGAGGMSLAAAVPSAAGDVASRFHRDVKPLLTKYCYDCHADGVNKGSVAFDEFVSDADVLGRRDLWLAAVKNVRAGLMPPREEGDDDARPTAEEIERLGHWVKYGAFGIDPANPDPGRVTARRLNRVEYRNTIRDLMGHDFNSEVEFPPDDSGHGFDNNGDVLTISPLLLEKYLAAAEAIVDAAVPKVSRVIHSRTASARDFVNAEGKSTELLSAKRAAKVSRTFSVEHDERYQLAIELEIRGSFDFDPSRCKVTCRVDGAERFVEEIVWHERKTLRHDYDVAWTAGEHVVEFEVEPLPPVETPPPTPREIVAAADPAVATPEGIQAAEQALPASVKLPPLAQTLAARLDVRIASVQVNGPLAPKFWVAPENHARFFPKGPAPEEPAARDAYAHEVLHRFATRAFRRPVEAAKIAQLAAFAHSVYTQPGKTFEEGIARAMMAVIASPRFLFRVETPMASPTPAPYASIDEYALASRLSYFLWSTMPDDELFGLAERGELRKELRAQVARMLQDKRSQAFVRDFTGQWLQARDIEFVPINARAVLGLGERRRGGPRVDFDGPLRKLMRTETEMYFEHVLREDRSVLELIDSDYTFLNARLAGHYGVPDVGGGEMRLVKLPAGSPRGGVLTQGTVLAVTSNPTRTSPVKRGLFVLENILGTPPPPPPPDVPDLEEAKEEFKGREPKLSEMLAVHRANALCSSCHERMDPLGLAFENFNAMGNWRDQEAKQPIEPAGKLATGETFADVRELKRVLATARRLDFYRCLTEKLMTYALGRGVEYYDTHTVDEIVERLVRDEGRMSSLLFAVIEAPAFQKMRVEAKAPASHLLSASKP